MSKYTYNPEDYPNFLFTVEEFNSSKSKDKLPLKCQCCNTVFYRTKNQIQIYYLRDKQNITCRNICSYRINHKEHNSVKTVCSNCNKEIIVQRAVFKEHNFCCKSCANSYSNRHRTVTEEQKKKVSNTLHLQYKEKTGYYSYKEKRRCTSFLMTVEGSYKSKHGFFMGYHTTWENKKVLYRSSYELDYYRLLDEQKIAYDVEPFRIKYYNSQKERIAIAIPDVYLPDSKTIVEIKSDYTYNKQEMIDKSNEYKRLGFNFVLIYEHQKYYDCSPEQSKSRIQ